MKCCSSRGGATTQPSYAATPFAQNIVSRLENRSFIRTYLRTIVDHLSSSMNLFVHLDFTIFTGNFRTFLHNEFQNEIVVNIDDVIVIVSVGRDSELNFR